MEKSYYVAGALILLAAAGALYLYLTMPDQTPGQNAENKTAQNGMSFFITSKNPGRGADLGGLSGADNYCQALASLAGAGDKTWRAYLSTNATAYSPAINARDRIGAGPWRNANGVIIANNLEELHNNNNINKQTALDEKGEIIKGRGDSPNWHDILTGSAPDGRAIATTTDATCGNWTKSEADGSAMVGHHDRLGTSDTAAARSWNSSHLTRGCGLPELATTGSGGLLYCFALP